MEAESVEDFGRGLQFCVYAYNVQPGVEINYANGDNSPADDAPVQEDGGGTPTNPCRLTPREFARLQGFPNDFKIPVSDTQAYQQLENSVVVPLMEDVAGLIAKEIRELDGKMEA